MQRVQQRLVAGFTGHIRHAGKQVHGTHRMALRRGLLQHRQVYLVVIRVDGLVLLQQLLVALLLKEAGLCAAVEDEILRQLPVLVLAGQAVGLHQGQLDFLMAGIGVNLPLPLAEGIADQVHQLVHDLQEAVVPRHLGVGHSGFQHMPGAVQLMAVGQLLPLPVGLFQDKVGVHIAVGLLGLADQTNDLLQLSAQLLRVVVEQREGRALHPLGQVAVLKLEALELALLQARRNPEIADGMAGSGAGLIVIENAPLIGQHALRRIGNQPVPESVRHTHLRNLNHFGHHACLLLYHHRMH